MTLCTPSLGSSSVSGSCCWYSRCDGSQQVQLRGHVCACVCDADDVPGPGSDQYNEAYFQDDNEEYTK